MKQKLDIIFLDFDDIRNPLLGAGQARATVEVGKRLTAMGHRLTILCSNYPGATDRKEYGMYYKHIGFASKNIRLNNLIYIFTLPWYVMRLKADIIVECFSAPISVLFSPLFTKIPVVALPSSFDAERFSKLYHLPFSVIEKFGLRFYNYYLPFSDYYDKKLKKVNPTVLSKIVPEGVAEDFFTIQQTAPNCILFLGRLDINQKGIDLLLQAYSKIAKTVGYPLIIAGNGPDEEKVAELISSLHLEKQVTMIGATYGAKKRKILGRSLFVAFSSRHETFSCFALEALASGLPLVAFDIPGLGWTDDSVVFKAKSFDVDEYARLLKKSAMTFSRQKFATKTKQFAKQFTWTQVAQDFELFFYEILRIEADKNAKKLTKGLVEYVK